MRGSQNVNEVRRVDQENVAIFGYLKAIDKFFCLRIAKAGCIVNHSMLVGDKVKANDLPMVREIKGVEVFVWIYFLLLEEFLRLLVCNQITAIGSFSDAHAFVRDSVLRDERRFRFLKVIGPILDTSRFGL